MRGDARAGGEPDREAFRALLRDTAPALLAYFGRRLPVREDAADAVAETMMTAWRRTDQLPSEPDEARRWLYGIAANVLANQRRSGRRREALAQRLRARIADAPASGGPDLAENVAVRDAIARLPEPQRELVTLVHWDGLTLAEAADVLGVNASTARSRYAVARRALREALTVEGASP